MTSICCDSNLTQTVEISSLNSVKIGQKPSQALSRSHVKPRFNTKHEIAKFFSAIKRYVILKHNQRIDRLAFRTLMSLDDALLKDIGVTRHDVIWANNLPLSENAAEKLHEISRRK